jgi:hypothetical protein
MPRGEGIYDDEDTEEPAGEGGDGGEAHDDTPDMAEPAASRRHAEPATSCHWNSSAPEISIAPKAPTVCPNV